jgi:Uma2 family endonuclease
MMPPPQESPVGQRIRPLKRVEYDHLMAAGYFEHERVELLFGMVVEMPPISTEHNESTTRTHRLLDRQLADRADVRTQCSYAATDDSQPEPDVFVVPRGDYWREHPARAFLVVEVSRSSIQRDRAKRELYAAGHVDEYWIVNHDKRVVEVYREPMDGMWCKVTIHGIGETISMLAFPDVHVVVAEILPPIA